MIRFERLLHLCLIILLTGLVKIPSAYSQSEAGEFIRGGIEDAETLMGAYLQPFGKSFGANMNSGWVNTAQPLNLGRFEVKFVANVGLAPDGDKYYNFDDLDLQGDWERSQNRNPTLMGPSDTDEAGRVWQEVIVNGQTERIPDIDLPAGTGIGFNPIPPAAQLSVGLIKGTEIMGRYIPSTNIGGGQIDMWGLGLKHDIKQWIPVINKLPFDLSVAFAYSDLNTQYGISIDPKSPEEGTGFEFADPDITGTDYNGPAYNASDYENQNINFNGKAWNANLLISKKLSVLSVYGGIRYAKSETNIEMTGTYGYPTEPYYNASNVDDPNNGAYKLVKIDPENNPSIEMPLSQVGLTGGFRLKLAVLTIFAEATYSRYSTVSAGIGLGWMN